ncbi:UDP-N-acetylglucosamine 2-epimerase (non-hydrolyzing) [bacterium]|nr:UDP-N-acetylglucosamine 2-epimerase (non-hydrolyzing) [bacterium]
MKIICVVGTRPDAIKMAPLIKKLKEDERFEVKVLASAQHREMLDVALRDFDIIPDYDLNVMRRLQSLEELSARLLKRVGEILRKEKPDMMIVQGDTTTTFISSLVAFYQKVRVAHLEAGLRTNDKFAPFPEEINRRLTTHIADLHFAPTRRAKENLLREGIEEERIFVTGNTVIDALEMALEKNCELPVSSKGRYILLTMHRRENWGEPMRRVALAVKKLLKEFKDLELVFPMHRNPIVRRTVKPILKGERIHLLEPLSFIHFVKLMQGAYFIMTDSGGIQEEASYLGKPVLILREVTERPEVVEAGCGVLVGTEEDKIVEESKKLLQSREEYVKMSRKVKIFGDGKAKDRVYQAILYFLGWRKEKVEEFEPIC